MIWARSQQQTIESQVKTGVPCADPVGLPVTGQVWGLLGLGAEDLQRWCLWS